MDEEWAKRSNVLPAAPSSPSKSAATKSQAFPQKSKASTSAQAAKSSTSKPAVPILPVVAPPATTSTQSMDVDGEGDMGGGGSDNDGEGESYGYQGPMSSVIRDAESDNIVYQLERGLPRWPGYGEKGWWEDASLVRISSCTFLHFTTDSR